MALWDAFLPGRNTSRDIARNRLKTVIIADQLHCQTSVIELLTEEMSSVISKYMDIDSENMKFHVAVTEHVSTLYASIPIRDIPYKGIL